VYGFGNLVGYQILVGTFVPSIGGSLGLHADPDIERILIMIILCCGVVFPLALFKNLSAFRFTSLLSAFSVLYVTILVTVQFGFFAPENDYSELNYFKVDLNIFSSFSICLYAYACHINITQIQGELINTSEQRMLKASRRALVTVLVPYMLTGVFGYLSLLNDVPSLIIMRSAPDSINNDWMMVVGRVLMSITLILAIPLNVLPCRKQIQRVILRLEGEPTCTT
jgi:sodium-coupled neutral amino acid transporter 6